MTLLSITVGISSVLPAGTDLDHDLGPEASPEGVRASLEFPQLSCHGLAGKAVGSSTQPLTFEHQGIVVMDLQTQISGGAWATKG